MEIIVTHDHSDFDALAAQVAAKKCYPDALIVRSPRLSKPVRDFLALHKDYFPTTKAKSLDLSAVTRLIIVDVRRRSRLKGIDAVLKRIDDGDPTLEVHIYDHHPSSEEDVVGGFEEIQPVGSATTLLVERMRASICLNPVEATLLALGVYTDTGALTYALTTGRDAAAVAWLLDQGANLKMINRYLRNVFSETQREVLSRLLGQVELHKIGGATVGFAIVRLDHFVGGLAEVTMQVVELEGHDALFAIYPIGENKVQVIARARVPFVDVGQVLESIGGGGHAGAAAAIIKTATSPEEIQLRLLKALRAAPPRPRIVRELMSSPVHTVAPEQPLLEVLDALRLWQHRGVPVVRDHDVIGVVSRRDIEIAERANRVHLPVSSCMSHHPKTIAPDDSLEAALEMMVKEDIGRLPVIEHGRLIGIISRSDLLRILYPRRTCP